MTYIIAAIVGLVALYGGAWVAGYIREAIMLNDLAKRLPQTDEEWLLEWEREKQHEDMLWEIDRLEDEKNRDAMSKL